MIKSQISSALMQAIKFLQKLFVTMVTTLQTEIILTIIIYYFYFCEDLYTF